jgi:hypothetical protein
MTTELLELKLQFEELQKKYRTYLPKVDPALVDNLLLRQMENPDIVPMYLLEVFTKEGLDTEEMRNYIINKTGMSTAIYDNGTHYVTNQKLTLDILKEISDSEDVLEVTGEYTGGLGSYGASHDHRDRLHKETWRSEPPQPSRQAQPEVSEPKVIETKGKSYRLAIYTAAGIAGALALAGLILSGGMAPNVNTSTPVPAGPEPGVVHGYVRGPTGLPAIGATVLAVQQGTDFAASAFVSVSGEYNLNLPPGEYVIVVAFPDGTNKIVNGFEVTRGEAHELNVSY